MDRAEHMLASSHRAQCKSTSKSILLFKRYSDDVIAAGANCAMALCSVCIVIELGCTFSFMTASHSTHTRMVNDEIRITIAPKIINNRTFRRKNEFGLVRKCVLKLNGIHDDLICANLRRIEWTRRQRTKCRGISCLHTQF